MLAGVSLGEIWKQCAFVAIKAATASVEEDTIFMFVEIRDIDGVEINDFDVGDVGHG